jgi:hypothetical protein
MVVVVVVVALRILKCPEANVKFLADELVLNAVPDLRNPNVVPKGLAALFDRGTSTLTLRNMELRRDLILVVIHVVIRVLVRELIPHNQEVAAAADV